MNRSALTRASLVATHRVLGEDGKGIRKSVRPLERVERNLPVPSTRRAIYLPC